MITVKSAYIGNGTESYIEKRFTDGINVIYSKDNNRGKTILMQGIMFALGASPTFPNGFQFREYLYVVDLNVDGHDVSVLRSKNTFAVLRDNDLRLFESAGSFSDYWSQNIRNLPTIVKKGKALPVELDLYTQIAFVPQDGKSSAKIQPGHFNKDDFIEMIYALKGLDGRELDDAQAGNLKKRREELKGRVKTLRKQATALNERGTALPMVSAAADSRDTSELIAELEEARKEVSSLRKERSRLLDRLLKCKTTLEELNSLKIDTKEGRLFCFDCGSNHIGYRMADSEALFDVTTPNMRTQIINSLNERILSYESRIDTVEQELRKAQHRLADLLASDNDFSLADIVACKEDYLDAKEIDAEIETSERELNEIKDKLEANRLVTSGLQKQRHEFIEGTIGKMNYARQYISDNDQSVPYNGLLTTSTNVFSGSDETIYFAAREYALALSLEHGMPLLIDSFRSEDLSTAREDRMIDLFTRLGNQMILTTTVKEEEGDGKYENDGRLHAIDYSNHRAEKLLDPSFNDAFAEKVSLFGILLKA